MARPRNFEPAEALQKALMKFWRDGYRASSLDQLVTETGTSRKGLYTVFGNKRELYLACLSLYRETVVKQLFGPLFRSGAGKEAVHEVFEGLLVRAQPGSPGCLLCNAATEMAPTDETVALLIQDHLDTLATAFNRALGSPDDSEDGVFLAGVLQGFLVAVRAGHLEFAKVLVRSTLSRL